MPCRFSLKCWNFSGNAGGSKEVKSVVLSNPSSPGFTEQKSKPRKRDHSSKGQLGRQVLPEVLPQHLPLPLWFQVLLSLRQWAQGPVPSCLIHPGVLCVQCGSSAQDALSRVWAYVLIRVRKSLRTPVCLLGLLIAASFTLQSDPAWITNSFVNLSGRHGTTLWLA